MDRVRFGRALGMGARALWKAADAATSPDPRAIRTPARQGEVQPKVSVAGVKRGSKRFGEAVWKPVARASGVLWLEVTGTFFALFAVVAAGHVWKRRSDFYTGGEPRQHLWFAVGMLVVFGWFAGSSFLRAAKRGRR